MTPNARAHGLTRYKHGPDQDGTEGKGCRCGVCRAANHAHDDRRTRMIAYGRWEPFTDAGPAREHVRRLTAMGLGAKRIAQLAGVSDACIGNLLHGRRGKDGRPPTRRIRHATEAAILAVRFDIGHLPSGAQVDATGTRRRVQALARLGWPARTVGGLAGVPHLASVIRQGAVGAGTAAKVRDVYDRLWDKPPPAGTLPERRAMARVRNRAARLGWPAPLAWDDDTIDDPAAAPAQGWERRDHVRRWGVLAEEASELITQGLEVEHVAERLGVSRKTLNKTLARVRREDAADAA